VFKVSRHRPHIKAEHTKAQGWSLVEQEILALGINANDFGLYKGHPSSIAEMRQIDTQLVSPINSSDQAGHHA
jgi:hypothetical protein